MADSMTDARRRAVAEDAVRSAADEPDQETVDGQEPATPPVHAPPRPARRARR
ncbi:hypothetical protein [Actinophytocola sediminis]